MHPCTCVSILHLSPCIHVLCASPLAPWAAFSQGWKLEHPTGAVPCRQPVRHPPLFSFFIFFFLFVSSRFLIPPLFPLQSMAEAVLPPRVVIPASQEGASLASFFLLPLGALRPSENPHQTNIPPKIENTKRREEQRHFWHLPEMPKPLGRGFIGCYVFLIVIR